MNRQMKLKNNRNEKIVIKQQIVNDYVLCNEIFHVLTILEVVK